MRRAFGCFRSLPHNGAFGGSLQDFRLLPGPRGKALDVVPVLSRKGSPRGPNLVDDGIHHCGVSQIAGNSGLDVNSLHAFSLGRTAQW